MLKEKKENTFLNCAKNIILAELPSISGSISMENIKNFILIFLLISFIFISGKSLNLFKKIQSSQKQIPLANFSCINLTIYQQPVFLCKNKTLYCEQHLLIGKGYFYLNCINIDTNKSEKYIYNPTKKLLNVSK